MLAENRDIQQITLLLVFVISVTPVAIYSERHQGSADNQLIGPLWGVVLLAAVGWRVAGRRRGPRVVTGMAVAALAALGLALGNSSDGEIQQLAGMNRIRESSPSRISIGCHRSCSPPPVVTPCMTGITATSG